MNADFSAPAIELASEAAFRLGDVEVRPPTREVLAPERREVLEPRVMQVLVALARRRGEVVSRDALVASCWRGRAVGEDAIQRCIAKLRRLAGATGGFEIETLARVGYRLIEHGIEHGASAAAGPRRLRLVAALALAALLAAATAVVLKARLQASRDRQPATVAVLAFTAAGHEPQATAFARSMGDELVGLVNDSAIRTTVAPSAGGLRLSGAVYQAAGRMRVTAKLEYAPSQVTVWTDEFEEPAADAAALRDEVAGAAAEAIYSGVEALQWGGRDLDPQVLGQYIAGQAALHGAGLAQEATPLRAFEEVTARAPRFAAGHALLALSLANASSTADPPAAGALAARARAEAARAIELNPAEAGPAYDALFWFERRRKPSNWLGAEDVLLRGLAAAPSFPFGAMRECRFLISVGRPGAGLPYCQKALALRPLAQPIDYAQAHVLYAMGRADLARHELTRTAAYHPDYVQARRLRFEIEAFGDDPDAARAILDDPDRAPQTFSPPCKAALKAMLTARQTRRPADVERALNALDAAVLNHQCDPRYAVLGAAALGDLDRAFAALEEPRFAFDPEDGDLFEPAAAPLRKDPRFWRTAARQGLVDYWRARRAWPEFCSSRPAGEDCAALARRAGV